MFTRVFWSAALERALKTAAQSAVLVIGADQVNVLAVSWSEVGGFALGAFARRENRADEGAGRNDKEDRGTHHAMVARWN